MDNVHENHRQRMRKRYISHGLDSFHDHELLEMMLYYCYPRRDTNEIAHKFLQEFKSLHALFDATPEALVARLGCSENVAMLLNLMPAIAKRYLQSRWQDKPYLPEPMLVADYLQGFFVDALVEKFYVLCMDAQQRLNKAVLISKGTVDEVPVFIREIFKAVLDHNATGIILAHNHPSGSVTPSVSDNNLTMAIGQALRVLDVVVHDHIIIAGNKYFSYESQTKGVVGGYLQ